MSRDEAYAGNRAERASGLTLRATRRGEVLGDTYRLLELVGAGGMAEVYSAEHLRLGRTFAVKVLRAGPSQQNLQRFRREARAIARIENEFVVAVIDCGEAGDATPYLVMELLHGEDLGSLLEREGALPIPRAVNFVWEACQGIAAVHALSLVHRDLKPENLYVTKRATGQDWCRVLDFGIAKSDLSRSTSEGAVLGTVRYMAPEQLQDAASAGPTVDVYALGAVLYECLSGAPPLCGNTVQELMFKILNEQPQRLERSRPGVPKGLADAVERALAKLPAQRFADVRQFASAIAPYAKLAEIDEPDPRSATVDLERDVGHASSARRIGIKTYAAIALSGMVGLSAGAALRGTVVRTSAHIASVSSAPPPVAATILSTTASAVPRLPQATLASVPTDSSTPPKPIGNSRRGEALDSGSARRPPVLPRARFDSENPYGR